MTRRHKAMLLSAMIATLVVSLAGTAAAEQVTEIDWATQPPLSGEVVDGRVVLDASGGGTYPLAVIDAPALSGGDIALSVDVVVGEMESPGYLELWAVYDDGSRYFSRSFDDAGVGLLRSEQSLTIDLPFGLSGTVPDALELNAVLPEGGLLEVGAVVLDEIGAGTGGPGVTDDGAWWSPQMGGVLGGLAGAGFGVLGALLGVLASRRKARRFVTGTLITGTVLGGLAAVVGVVAVTIGQPYHVWFPLLLVGVIVAAVFGANIRTVAVGYETMELQKMRAFDMA